MELKLFYHNATQWLLLNGARLVIGVIILIVGLKLIKYFGARIRARMSKQEVHSSLQPFFLSLAITALYIGLFVAVLTIIGFDLAVFSTILGGFTVAVGLALSGTFQNFAGGVLILLLKPFELDDSIVAQGQSGKVTSIQIFYTVLITVDNKTVIIPNGKLFNEVIINVTREGRRRLDIDIKIGYAAEVEQVITIMNNAIKASDAIIDDPGNRVGVSAMEVDGVRYLINVWVAPGDFLTTKLFLQRKILNDLRANGVKLPGVV